MSESLPPSFVLSYATEPQGFVLLARTHGGSTEMVGGRLDFLTGALHVTSVAYRTTEALGAAAEAARQALAKPATAAPLGAVPLADAAEALAFLQALAEAYRTGSTSALPKAWDGSAQLLFEVVPPHPINAVRVLAEGAAPSAYDW